MKLYYAGFNLYGQIINVSDPVVKSFIELDYDALINIEFGHYFTLLLNEESLILHGAKQDLTYQIQNINIPAKVKQICVNEKRLVLLSKDGNLYKANIDDVKEMRKLNFLNVENELVDETVKISSGENINIALTKSCRLFNVPSQLQFKNDNILDVCTGREHCLMLDLSGNVYSFGAGSRGQLGHGCLEAEVEPRLIEALAGIKMIKIAAGGWHSCAVSEDGDLYSWGWNGNGQLGCQVDEQNISVMATPGVVDFQLDEERNVVGVACGTRHTVFLLDDSKLFGMGWNKYYQLGCTSKNENVYKPQFLHDFNNKSIGNLKCGPWSTAVY